MNDFKKKLPGSTSRLKTVDHSESYGRHILRKIVENKEISKCVDIGCGRGYDLSIVNRYNPNADLFGLEFSEWSLNELNNKGIILKTLNIEKDKFPFKNESIDFIIANQVIEHVKEIFWINNEIFRCLKIGGYFFLGVPNILSFHNRVLGLFGIHPTQHKSYSAHLRPFSKRDVYEFYKFIGSYFCEVVGFWGSQFYPFPRIISRPLSNLFPSLSFSIFFLIKKTKEFENQFIEYPIRSKLETNFFVGDETRAFRND